MTRSASPRPRTRRASAEGAGNGTATRARRPEPPVDQQALQRLVGYHCRRAYLAISERSLAYMAERNLRPASYSVLALLLHNTGLSSRQVCKVLSVQPPNLVALVAALEARGLIRRQPDPDDGRALALHLTAAGRRLVQRMERDVTQAEIEATSMLSESERRLLISLLTRIYYRVDAKADRPAPDDGAPSTQRG